MSDFEGLRALVTGGASGIGRATADLLAERGAQVAVLDLDPSPVDKP
ncbi:SDR family NAD(P)-dependent oxidoreductase, partial [Streptomyces sp. NPDC006129]